MNAGNTKKAWITHCLNSDIIDECGDKNSCAELRFDGRIYIICFWEGHKIVETQSENFYSNEDIMKTWEDTKRYYNLLS